MQSKEEAVLELFFNYPTKEWHFEELLKKAKITRSKADAWLKRFTLNGLVKRVKQKGRMPFYISNYASPVYMHKKKLFAMERMYQSGFLNHLSWLPNATTVIIFGSFVRSDWYEKSDIDLFIYGDPAGLKIAQYEAKLHRNIQVFVCSNKKDLIHFGPGLIKNIIKGSIIKGDIDFIRVDLNA